MPPYEQHLFMCTHDRGADNPRGCCAQKGSLALLKQLKAAVRDHGLEERVRVNKAGCLGGCENGISVVVYPAGTWYRLRGEEDVETLLKEARLQPGPARELLLPGTSETE